MGKTSRAGKRKFITPKIDFFISPAYFVPPMRMMRRVKSVMMNVLECVPSRSGTRLELGRGNHREFRLVAGQFVCRHAHEQLLYEQGMPGILGDNLHRKPVVLVSAGIQIENIQIALPHVRHNPRQQSFEFRRIEGLVHLAPIHRVAGDGIPHDELVARGTPGSRAGERHQGAIVSQAGLTPGNRRFYQLRGRQVPVDVGAFDQLSCQCGCLD